MDPENILQLRHYQFPSEEIITNFSYEAFDMLAESRFPGVQRTAVDSLEGRTANYTKYDLFCFNSKLAEKIRSVNQKLSHQLNPKQYEDRIHMCVELYHGYTQIPITEEWKDLLEQFVLEAEQEAPGKFLFFSGHSDLPMRGEVLTSAWLLSIVSKISLTEYINYNGIETFALEPEVIDGRIYMRLHPDTDYKTDLNQLKQDFLRYLIYLYKEGTIALLPDSFMIGGWELTEIGNGLYTANWTNVLFAKQKTEFLLRMLVEQFIIISTPKNNVIRHHIAQKMPYQFYFAEENIIVFVDSLRAALKASSVVTKSLRYDTGDVILTQDTINPHEGYSFVRYYNLGTIGYLNSYLKL